jgi:hypothetical protein
VETGQSNPKIKNNNNSGENTLEPSLTVANHEEKQENIDNKINSLGMAAEDYRGLLQINLDATDRNKSAQDISDINEEHLRTSRNPTVEVETRNTDQKIT